MEEELDDILYHEERAKWSVEPRGAYDVDYIVFVLDDKPGRKFEVPIEHLLSSLFGEVRRLKKENECLRKRLKSPPEMF